jgi:putative membrane protein insertion efficiency factor
LLIALAVPLYFVLKYLAIGCVLMYKAFAPEQVRESCRFEPTCSTYMIIAIKKYGLFRGVFRGVRRIMRCHPPNGGTDLP